LESEIQYEIEKVLDKKFMKGNDGKRRLYYFIKWKNYDNSHNSWEPKSELGNAKEIIKEFEKGRKANK
jgi:chromobox protein 5